MVSILLFSFMFVGQIVSQTVNYYFVRKTVWFTMAVKLFWSLCLILLPYLGSHQNDKKMKLSVKFMVLYDFLEQPLDLLLNRKKWNILIKFILILVLRTYVYQGTVELTFRFDCFLCRKWQNLHFCNKPSTTWCPCNRFKLFSETANPQFIVVHLIQIFLLYL